MTIVVRGRASARWQVAAGLAGPAVLAALLPAPGQLLAQIRAGSDPLAALGGAVLLAVSVVVWGLMAWALLVVVTATLTRMPGTIGRSARSLLRLVAPAAARRMVILATGMSLMAGLAACGTSEHAGAAPGTGTPASVSVSVSEPLAAVAPAAAGSGSPTTAATDSGAPAGPASHDGGYAGPEGEQGTSDGATSAAAVPTAPATTRTVHLDLDWPVATPIPQASATDPPSAPPSAAPSALPSAAPSAARPTGGATTPAAHTPPSPSRSASAPAAQVPPSAAPSAKPAVVVVRPGDSLWSIAAGRLPAGAPTARIDQAWRAWYAANHDVIGDDPNLILPGQRLVPPDSAPTPS